MIKVKCDWCGDETQGTGTSVKVGIGLLSRAEINLPEGWRRIDVPKPGGVEVKRTEVCPPCTARLWRAAGGTVEQVEQVDREEPEADEEPDEGYEEDDEEPEAPTAWHVWVGCPRLQAGVIHPPHYKIAEKESGDGPVRFQCAGFTMAQAQAVKLGQAGDTVPSQFADCPVCGLSYKRGGLVQHMQDTHGKELGAVEVEAAGAFDAAGYHLSRPQPPYVAFKRTPMEQMEDAKQPGVDGE